MFNKQFEFRVKHSTRDTITKLVDAILNGFSEEKYTLRVFIDLPKAFNTVNHQILPNKLSIYVITGKSLSWFETSLQDTICGVPQGSILGPLMILPYINDPFNASNIITSIIIANDPNLFYSKI